MVCTQGYCLWLMSYSIRRIDYVSRLKGVNQLLRLLVNNELQRLIVWDNPLNDAKRSIDLYGTADRGMLDVCAFMANY